MPNGQVRLIDETSPAVLSEWARRLLTAERLDDDGLALLAQVAANPRTPPDVLRHIVEAALACGWWPVTRYAAANPALPQDLLARLAITRYRTEVRCGAAENPAAPPELLRRLARDRSQWVRYALASNPACPPDALRRLLRDRQTYVRLRAAGNPSTGGDLLLEHLTRRLPPWPPTRSEVAVALGNPNFPVEWLCRLARHVLVPAAAWTERFPLGFDLPAEYMEALVAEALACPRLPAEALDEALSHLLGLSGPEAGCYPFYTTLVLAGFRNPSELPGRVLLAALLHEHPLVRAEARWQLKFRGVEVS